MALMDLQVTAGRGIHWLTGNLELKRRIQHPTIKEETGTREPYWFIRVFEPVIRRGGAVDDVRKKYILGPSKGPEAIGVKEAQLRADKILARINGLTQPPEKAGQAALGDFILFERLVEMFREGHLPNIGFGTRKKYEVIIGRHLLPRFTGERLDAITHHDIQVWMNGIRLAWGSKDSIRSCLSRVFEYANENNLYKARNPCHGVNCGRKKFVRSKDILNPELMGRILERVDPRRRLVIETALSNGMRVSEVLGMRWRQIHWDTGFVKLEERYYRGDVDTLKTQASERKITLTGLLDEYRELYRSNGRPAGDVFIFDRGDGSGEPVRDETVREALKAAAKELGVDFLGLGMHTLRRANITWRQGIGASSIEASRMAGHSRVHMTAEYTQVEDRRLQETTAAVRRLWQPKKTKKKNEGGK